MRPRPPGRSDKGHPLDKEGRTLFNLIGFAIVGLIAGALARLIVPGRDPMGCLSTMLLGMAGSFVGGFLGSLLFFGEINLRASNNFIGAVIGAVIALLLYRSFSARRRV